MPLKRLERTRESLPAGYQFGDAGRLPRAGDRGVSGLYRIGETIPIPARHWKQHWDVIEGEQHAESEQ